MPGILMPGYTNDNVTAEQDAVVVQADNARQGTAPAGPRARQGRRYRRVGIMDSSIGPVSLHINCFCNDIMNILYDIYGPGPVVLRTLSSEEEEQQFIQRLGEEFQAELNPTTTTPDPHFADAVNQLRSSLRQASQPRINDELLTRLFKRMIKFWLGESDLQAQRDAEQRMVTDQRDELETSTLIYLGLMGTSLGDPYWFSSTPRLQRVQRDCERKLLLVIECAERVRDEPNPALRSARERMLAARQSILEYGRGASTQHDLLRAYTNITVRSYVYCCLGMLGQMGRGENPHSDRHGEPVAADDVRLGYTTPPWLVTPEGSRPSSPADSTATIPFSRLEEAQVMRQRAQMVQEAREREAIHQAAAEAFFPDTSEFEAELAREALSNASLNPRVPPSTPSSGQDHGEDTSMAR